MAQWPHTNRSGQRRHIQETRQYINDFIHLNEKIPTARELYDRMLAIYPDWVNPGSLWGSANAEGTDDKIDLRR